MKRKITSFLLFIGLFLILICSKLQAQYFAPAWLSDTNSCVDGNPLHLQRNFFYKGASPFQLNGFGTLDSVYWRNNGTIVARKSPISKVFTDSTRISGIASMVARPDGAVFFTKYNQDVSNFPHDSLIGVKNGNVIYSKELDVSGLYFLTADKVGNIYVYMSTRYYTGVDSIFLLTPSNDWTIFNTVTSNLQFNIVGNSPFTCDDYGNVYTVNADSLHFLKRISNTDVKLFEFSTAIVIDTTSFGVSGLEINCGYNDRTITIKYNNGSTPSSATMYYDEVNDVYSEPNLNQESGKTFFVKKSNTSVLQKDDLFAYYSSYSYNSSGVYQGKRI